MDNNQQYTATFSLNGQQARDEIKRITEQINQLDVAMNNVDKSTAAGREQFKKMHEQQSKNKEDLKQMQSMSKALKSAMIDLDKASPNKLRQTMRDINKAMDSGAIKRGTRDWQEALKVLNKCDNELKKINAEQKSFGKGGGGFNLGSMFSGGIGGITKLAGALGIAVGAFQAIAKVLGDLVSKNKEFEQANANLASVLGTTRDKISDLTQMAKMLGATTQYTATEVTQLQTELAKLGFTSNEITNSTKAILDFASATGAELPDAAALAGASLRAFGLDASEMERVVSTMAVATTKSALDFSKLQTSMSIVAPVAKQFGFSIEETVALLGKLSDAGFDASSAATATRNIFLYMADSSSKLSKALGHPIKSIEDLGPAFEELKAKGIDLADMLDLTDKRAVAAFATLVSSGDGLVQLKNEITDCSDALGNMVDERMNTLEGSTIKLSSAWDGLMLTFSNSTGIMKSVTDWITDMINGLTDLLSTESEMSGKRVFEGVNDTLKEERKKWKEELNEYDLEDQATVSALLDSYSARLTQETMELENAENELYKANNKLDNPLTNTYKDKYGETYFDTQTRAQAEKAQKDLEARIVRLKVDMQRLEYMKNNLNSIANRSTTTSHQSDPRSLKIAKLEADASKSILGVNSDETLDEDAKADKIYAINKALFTAKRDLYQQDEKEYYLYDKKINEIESKHEDALQKRKIKQEQADKKEEQFQNKIEAGNKSYESSLAKLTAEEKRYEGIVAGDESWKIRQQKAINALKIQRDALTQTYTAAKENLDKMEQAEIEHGADEEATRQKYLEKRNALEAQYNKALEANTTATNATIAANTKETFKKTIDTVKNAMQQVADVMNHVADLISASYDLQIAKVEERYDAEIEAAEKAGKDTTELEEKKKKETAKIEKKQAAADFKMSLAQAFIDAATASLKVWADPGYPMAIPLQAVIATNQALTIATLTKQYKAKLASIGQYYDGGYTGSERRYHRAVGIVHDGEFVANHNTVNNPEIRPALDAINYAQKTNTASSMTRSDLAAAIGFENGGYTSPTSVSRQDDRSIRQLTAVLNRIDMYGIEAHTYVNGRGGINEAQAKNTRLYKNAHR